MVMISKRCPKSVLIDVRNPGIHSGTVHGGSPHRRSNGSRSLERSDDSRGSEGIVYALIICGHTHHMVDRSMLTQDYVGLVLVYAVIAVSLLTSAVMERRNPDVDARKIVHIGVGFFVFVWWMFSENWIMLVFFTIPFAILLFITMFQGNALSRSKLGELSNEKGHRSGLFLYAVTITILVAFFFDHWTAASIGIVAMTWGDGLGSVIGKKYGKHKILNKKSLEGSLAVFASTFIMTVVIIVFYGFLISSGYYPNGDVTAILPIWMVALIAGALASVLEAVCPGQIDNLVIPCVVAIVMVFLGL